MESRTGGHTDVFSAARLPEADIEGVIRLMEDQLIILRI